jgi:hypothetical protein
MSTSGVNPGTKPPLSTSVPIGTIVAWYNKTGVAPAGWQLCDGNGGAPNLNGIFLRGITQSSDFGGTGGAEKHHHVVSQDRNRPTPLGFEGEGNDCRYGNTDDVNNLPPYLNIFFIMKVADPLPPHP